jgi:hypothetical protein
VAQYATEGVEWTFGGRSSREVTVERAREEARARQAAMVEELRKAELVRDRLEGLDELARTYPEGHDMRVRLENLQLERTLRAVEEEVRNLRDVLIRPGGT